MADSKLAKEHGIRECVVDLRIDKNKDFGSIVVYLPRHRVGTQRFTSPKGEFITIGLKDVANGIKLTDWELERGVYLNRHGTQVKPVWVTIDGHTYLKAFLFARVRVNASRSVLYRVVNCLNNHLNGYKDHLRTGIAQEWCDQELWRIFPLHAKDCVALDEAGHQPFVQPTPVEFRDIMRDMLPKGFDTERPI